jgi:hypothetical protein
MEPYEVCSPTDAVGDTTNDDQEPGDALADVVVSYASIFMKYFMKYIYSV